MKKFWGICLTALFIGSVLTGAVACGDDTMENAHKISATGNENICEHCGQALYEGEIEYTLSENGKYYIADIDSAKGDVIVPGYYKGIGDKDYLPVLEATANSRYSLGNVELSAVVEKIDIAHEHGNNCSQIFVPAENPYYKTIDGVLFNKDETKLVCYPAKKEATSYTVPDTVKVIGERAFSMCSHLEELILPQNGSLKEIQEWAFYACEIVFLVIPASVEKIGNDIFTNWGLGDFTPTVYIPFEKDQLPEGWEADWLNIICNIEFVYGYTGN